MEGIIRVLQAARLLTDNHLAPNEEYGLVVSKPLIPTFHPRETFERAGSLGASPELILMEFAHLDITTYLVASWATLCSRLYVLSESDCSKGEIKRFPTMFQGVIPLASCIFPQNKAQTYLLSLN